MNKVILMGRLTKDPEVRYAQSSEPLAVARYTLAVNRRFKRQGEQDADFIGCVAFGKASFENNSSRGDYAPAAPAPAAPKQTSGGADGFYPIDESIEDDDLPF